MDAPTLYNPKIHTHLLPSLVTLHASCILSPPYTIANFLPPLSPTTMLAWWTTQSDEVAAGTRAIIMQLATNPSNSEEEVAGVVMLGMPVSETGPFRGHVEKLLVGPGWRKRGVARGLMEKLERVGRETGRTLLMLDTEEGSPAQLVYPRLGYIYVGTIPKEMISSFDGSLKGAVLFYKDLNDTKE